MPKNTSAFGDIQITPLSGQFDLRSPSGTLPITDFRLALNASMNEFGKRCRRPGWRKWGEGSPRGFNNQDLHNHLGDLQSQCGVDSNNCTCPGTPECIKLVDYEYGVVLENCIDGEDSTAEAWDGTLSRTDSCTWGFPYYNYSFGGKTMAAILTLTSCAGGVRVYRLEIVVRLEDGTGMIVWQGESQYVPVGTYERTEGCDNTPEIILENCGACVQPEVTASPPDGSTITEGTYVSLFSTDGAYIFFTTDGSEPDNTSELYTGPFQVNSTTTVKARAYTPSCIGAVHEFNYTTITAEDFLFQFTCDDEDQSGPFDVFDPNGRPDYNWNLQFSMGEVDVVAIEIYETDEQGKWVTGQSWATKRTIFPDERNGDPFASYPVVVFDTGVQVNNDYTPADGNLIDSNPAGSYNWMLYGQPFVPISAGFFKIVFIYNDGEEKRIYSVVPGDCGDYYY